MGNIFNLHFALDLFEEALEVGGGGGEDDLVRVEGVPAAAGQRHIREVVVAEYLTGEPEEERVNQVHICSESTFKLDNL